MSYDSDDEDFEDLTNLEPEEPNEEEEDLWRKLLEGLPPPLEGPVSDNPETRQSIRAWFDKVLEEAGEDSMPRKKVYP